MHTFKIVVVFFVFFIIELIRLGMGSLLQAVTITILLSKGAVDPQA